MSGHTQQGVLLDNFVICFHISQIVESPPMNPKLELQQFYQT